MIKKLHYIESNNLIDQICFNSYKTFLPDFKLCPCQTDSPMDVVGKEGGLFLGPGILIANEIPETLFQKSFIAFLNIFDSHKLNPNICYSDSENNPVFTELKEKGEDYFTDKKEIFISQGRPDYIYNLNEKDIFYDEIFLYNKDRFGYYDKLSKSVSVNKVPLVIDTNTHNHYPGSWNVRYMILNENTNPDEVYWACEDFSKLKEGNNFMLVVLGNKGSINLFNNISLFLNYHAFKEDKKWDAIIAPFETEKILAESLKNFEEVLSIKKAVN